MGNKEIILVVGIQGSGKSTCIEPYLAKGYARLNRDAIGGTVAALIPRMESFLSAERSVVLDNVFCTAQERIPFVTAAKKLGAKVSALVMDTSFEDAQYNVCQRMIQKCGKLLGPDEIKNSKEEWAIPPAALFMYRKNYEAPMMSEGFDSIESVHFVRKNNGYTNKAIIFDKDGTLTQTISGAKFPCTAADIRCLPNRKERLDKCVKDGYILLGASNQSGIGKGDILPAEATRIFQKTNELLGHNIDWGYCPHRSPPSVFCYCRKPAPGLGVSFIEKYKLNPSQCLYVGDMTTDKTFAGRCGFKYVDAKEFFGKV